MTPGPARLAILVGMKKLPTAKLARPARTGGSTASLGPAQQASLVEDIRDAVSRLKRERIISTAVELFHNNGLGNTTLEAVATRMNVTKPFIYSHFKSKEELLAEICSRGIRSSLDVLDRVVASSASATDKLATLAHDFMLAVLENQGHIAIYNREEKHLSADSIEAINKLRREFDRKFSGLLKEGVATGEFTVGDVQVASLAIGGIISWSYVWYRPDGRLSPEQIAQEVAALVLSMVQAKPRRRTAAAGAARMAPATARPASRK